MKRMLLSIPVVGLLLLSACGAPSPTPPSVSESVIPAHFTTYTDETGLFSISYPQDWELGLSLIEGKTIFVAGKPYRDGYNPNVSILLLPYKQTLLIPYQPTGDSTWKLEDFVETKVQEEIMLFEEYRENSRTKIVVGGKEAIVLDSQSQFPGIGTIRWLKIYMRDDKLVWMVICGGLPDTNFSDFETDFHAIVRSLRILK